MLLCRNIQRFTKDSLSKYPSSDAELNNARQQAIVGLKLSCSDRLTKLAVVILSDDDDDECAPIRKRPRQLSPKPSVLSDEDDDIGHVKVRTYVNNQFIVFVLKILTIISECYLA